jgi:uncharacterized SAM-dependent methyltransferase
MFSNSLPLRHHTHTTPYANFNSNLRKVNLLLEAIERTGKNIDYYALDLSRKELERTLAQLPAYKHVRSHGLWGTYDDGREWLKHSSNIRRQKCVLSLGSSIGGWIHVPTGPLFRPGSLRTDYYRKLPP